MVAILQLKASKTDCLLRVFHSCYFHYSAYYTHYCLLSLLYYNIVIILITLIVYKSIIYLLQMFKLFMIKVILGFLINLPLSTKTIQYSLFYNYGYIIPIT